MKQLHLGDHGHEVSRLQELLNTKSQRLPRLVVDGAFGPKTKARVTDFQKDNGLKPDGIVGDFTWAKLRNGAEPGSALDIRATMYAFARFLDPAIRPQFLRMAQEALSTLYVTSPTRQDIVPVGFVSGAKSPVIAATLVEQGIIIVLFFVIMMMIVLAQNSANPATRQMGEEWAKKFNRLKERIKDKPVETQTAETLQQTKRMAEDVKNRAISERDKCLSNLDPKKITDCAGVLKKLSEAIQSLIQKLNTGTGGGITPENLVKGIAFSVQRLMEIAREAAQCTGCDGLNL
ncbi:MAG TPA: peptidoglycan-binding domain-containing protein [Bryobacteraceae bacterium]|nr:peptidoglycan-binding domain-containing protein [Bryobacteraceae bacterium]